MILKKNKYLLKIRFDIFKKVFFIFSISYLCYALGINFKDISFRFNFNNIYLYFSFLFCFLSVLFNGLAWKNIIIWLGSKNVNNDITYFFIVSNSLKYVPGSIWHFVERFNFLKKKTNENIALYGTLIEPYLMLSASLLISSTGFIFNPFLIFLSLVSIFLNKRFIYLILRILKSYKGKKYNSFSTQNLNNKLFSSIKCQSFFPIKAFFIEVLFVLSKFLAFICCLNIFMDLSQINIFLILIIFCTSWSIGLIIPAAPSGAGVFETSFLLFIGKIYPQNLILETLIYFRFISTAADLFLSSPFLLKKFIYKN
tara:strand:- start:327 stop:1262 length:936 start_codon:yes stop_codon:yes gene_type:complete